MDNQKKIQLKNRFKTEIKKFLTYFIFFTLFFWTFTIYTRLIEGEYGLSYIHFGFGLIESLILAKIILLGQMLHVGERFNEKPLIYSTLWKTLTFCLLVVAFSIAEKFITGFIREENTSKIYEQLLNKGQYVIFAKILVMFFVFILFFAFLEIDRVLGERKLEKLFFSRYGRK